jgi:hypothetical protein
VISYQVISWFQSLPFKFNLHCYNAVIDSVAMYGRRLTTTAGAAHQVESS